MAGKIQHYIIIKINTLKMNQPTFLKFLPVTIHVGIWAFIWLWAGVSFGWVLWIPFISWAGWYSIGPTHAMRKKRFLKNLIGAFGGIVYAVAFILLIPIFANVFGSFAIPALGFLAGMTIVLLELTNWFEWAVGYFFTFAGFFAYAFGAFGAAGDYAIIFTGSWGPAAGYITDVGYFFLFIVVGFALGFVTDFGRVKLLNMAGYATEAEQKTIFDRESQ